jgi:tetratricopeptide (TPR) repeat protein
MAARLRPRDHRVWLALGRVLSARLDFHRAIPAYEKVLDLKRDHRAALIELIEALVDGGQSDRAAPWVTRALQEYPDDPAVLGWAARAAFDADRLSDALALADRALQRDPQNVSALLTRARSRVALSNWKDALPDAESAAAATPYDAGALQLLGIIEERLGLTQRAAATRLKGNRVQERMRLLGQLAEQIAHSPEDPQFLWRMGQVASELGGHLRASRCFEAALALDPNFQPARDSLMALRASHPELVRSTRPAAGRPGAAVGSLPSSTTSPERSPSRQAWPGLPGTAIVPSRAGRPEDPGAPGSPPVSGSGWPSSIGTTSAR